MFAKWKLIGFIAVMITGGLIAGGCSSSDGGATTTPGDLDEQTIDLNDANGGFMAVSEDPAFGDVDLAETVADEETVDNGYDGLSEAARNAAEAMENDEARRDMYLLTIEWGVLDRKLSEGSDAAADYPELDWAGSIALTEGAIRVVSLLSFEKPDGDRVLRGDELRPLELHWESTTHGGHDGIRVLLYVPSDPAGDIDDLMLTYSSEQAGDYTFTLSELAEMSRVEDVGDLGHQISFHSHLVDPTGATLRGFCGGHWGWATGDSVGTFRGRWVGVHGQAMGFLRGHYGENDEGAKVFFGKYIGNNGEFKGFLRGRYSIVRAGGELEEESYQEVGEFHGRWVDSEGNALGRIAGHWSLRNSKPGRFTGHWTGTQLIP
jgi:hypothetical protein